MCSGVHFAFSLLLFATPWCRGASWVWSGRDEDEAGREGGGLVEGARVEATRVDGPVRTRATAAAGQLLSFLSLSLLCARCLSLALCFRKKRSPLGSRRLVGSVSVGERLVGLNRLAADSRSWLPRRSSLLHGSARIHTGVHSLLTHSRDGVYEGANVDWGGVATAQMTSPLKTKNETLIQV